VFITGLTSSLDIGLSNWSLLFISITLYTMSKSTATVFVLLFAIILRLEKPRLVTIAVVSLIVGGLFLFTYKSTSFDWEGFILVITASFLTGLRWTSAQILLQKKELGLSNPLDTIFHLQPIMILTLVPLAAFADGGTMATSAKVFRASELSIVLKSSTIVLFAAVLAFFLEFSEFLFVSNTSSLAFSIAGVVKEVITLSISTTFFNDDNLSWINLTGMAVCLVGVTLHVVIKVKRLRGA
jgi:solute carrier family 35 protein C2